MSDNHHHSLSIARNVAARLLACFVGSVSTEPYARRLSLVRVVVALAIIACLALPAHAQTTLPNSGRNEPTLAAIRLRFAARVDAGCAPGFIIAVGPMTQDAQSDTFAVGTGLALLPHPDTMAVKRLEQFIGDSVEVIIRPIR